MNRCNCYNEVERLQYTPFYTQSYYKTVGICYGIKGRDECSCGGDETKCDFYPEKRAAAQARAAIESFKKNKKYTYEETKERFLLAWNANAYFNMCESSDMENVVKALDKQIPKKPEFVDTRFKHLGKHISDGTILAKCYKCPNSDCGYHIFHTFDSERYCVHCGQALDWTE